VKAVQEQLRKDEDCILTSDRISDSCGRLHVIYCESNFERSKKKKLGNRLEPRLIFTTHIRDDDDNIH
jgi:hypothetical protein